jgi:hypothetical protein
MIRELKQEQQFLKNLSEKYPDDNEVEERLNSIGELVSDVQNNGTTKGADQIVEFPTVPVGELHEFEKQILRFLDSHGPQESISALANALVEATGEDTDIASYKSKVQYNVNQLEGKGFVKIEKEKNRHKPTLDTVGELWVQTHEEEKPRQVKNNI